jgi:hypothetical protein
MPEQKYRKIMVPMQEDGISFTATNPVTGEILECAQLTPIVRRVVEQLSWPESKGGWLIERVHELNVSEALTNNLTRADDDDFYSRTFPSATPNPCDECPWTRTSTRGWLGPHTPEEWLDIAHGESPIACHKTIRRTDDYGIGDWANPEMRQCRGASIFRANVYKNPRHPDLKSGPVDEEHVFTTHAEFLAHHVLPHA